MKVRLDVFITKKGFAESREKAKFLIKEGCVKVNGEVITKPSKDIKENSQILITKKFDYVGRGGYKIEGAVRHFKINFDGKIGADVGCSIGGFTDYALKHGAKKIYAIDTGDNLHETLKYNERVVYIPNTDARNIKSLNEKIDFCLIDVTFSSIKEILAVVKNWLKPGGEVLGLIKPPFELQKHRKISDYDKCLEIAKKVEKWASENGYKVEGIIESELKGKSSNQQEFFIYLNKI